MIRTLLNRVARLIAGVLAGSALAYAVLQGAPAHAQTVTLTPAPVAAAAPVTTPADPALWVIRDADSTLYLFGTIHVLRADVDWRTPRIRAAFDSATDVWVEIENFDDQAALGPIMQRHGLSLTRPLSSLLTAEEFAHLDVAARSIDATAEQLNLVRPWLAGIVLAMAPLKKAGYDPNSGVERVLGAEATTAGKAIHGFETMEEQIGAIAGLPEADQLVMLRATLEDYDNAVVVIDDMVAAWAAGDVAALDRLVVEDMKDESEVVYRALLVDRNADWVEQIQGILAGSGTAFIAVGAAHLAGDDSVQAMLRARGVTVERVE